MKWFKHETSAVKDEKIQQLMDEHGIAGYGVYFILCELCAEKIDKSNPPEIEISPRALKRLSHIHRNSDLLRILSMLSHLRLISISSPFDVSMNDKNIIKIRIDNLLKRLDSYTQECRATRKPAAESSLSISLNNNNKQIRNNKQTKEWFESVWMRYPNKDGRSDAFRHFTNSVRTEEDFKNINKALEIYLKSERVRNGYVKNGSTWFRRWSDWIVDPITKQHLIILKTNKEVCFVCKNEFEGSLTAHLETHKNDPKYSYQPDKKITDLTSKILKP